MLDFVDFGHIINQMIKEAKIPRVEKISDAQYPATNHRQNIGEIAGIFAVLSMLGVVSSLAISNVIDDRPTEPAIDCVYVVEPGDTVEGLANGNTEIETTILGATGENPVLQAGQELQFDQRACAVLSHSDVKIQFIEG